MKNKYKLILLISIIIIGAFLLWDKLIDNKLETVEGFAYQKFDGEIQRFSIEKVFDNQQDMDFEGRKECEREFLKINPTFNENTDDKEETYYCEVVYTNFYYKTGVDFSGDQYCGCYYKK